MDDNGTLILALIALVAMSAFFSASETAYTSLNRARLKSLANGGSKRAERALALSEDYDRLLSGILVGNNTDHTLEEIEVYNPLHGSNEDMMVESPDKGLVISVYQGSRMLKAGDMVSTNRPITLHVGSGNDIDTLANIDNLDIDEYEED